MCHIYIHYILRLQSLSNKHINTSPEPSIVSRNPFYIIIIQLQHPHQSEQASSEDSQPRHDHIINSNISSGCGCGT